MPSSTPTPVISAGDVIVGDSDSREEPVADADGSASLANPKSNTLDCAVVADLDVRGLQVAVNDPLVVRGFQRFGNLFRNGKRLIDRNRTSPDTLR